MACEMMGLTNWALKIKSRFRLRAVVSLELLGLSNLQFLLIARNTHVEGTLKIFHRSNQGNSKETDLYNDECSAQRQGVGEYQRCRSHQRIPHKATSRYVLRVINCY